MTSVTDLKTKTLTLSQNAIKNKIETIIYKHSCYTKAVEQMLKSMKIPNLPILHYNVVVLKPVQEENFSVV